MARVKSFVDVRFWTETGVPAATGFFTSKVVGGMVIDLVGKAVTIPSQIKPYAKMAADAIGGAGLAWLVGRFYNKRAGDAVWLGTVVNVAHSLLKNLLGGTEIAKKIGLDGLGDDLAQRMKEQIAARVDASLRGYGGGMGAYLTYRDTKLNGLGEYATERAMRLQPAFSATPTANLKDYDPTYQGNDDL